jgi:hypothetical protein
MSLYLFSYGTLQREDVQLKLFGRKLEGSPDLLEGYSLAPVEITDEGFLLKGENKHQLTLIHGKQHDQIKGTALELTQAELIIADSYEPEAYRRALVRLASGKDAWVFLI